MNININVIKDIFFPAADKETLEQIDLINLITISRTGIIVAVVQSISLMIYTILFFMKSPAAQTIIPFISVGSSIIICLLFYILGKKIHSKTEYVKNNHNKILAFTIICSAVLLQWSILASVPRYILGHQILAFYTVELCILFFIKLPPITTIIMSTASFGGCYFYYTLFIDLDGFNTYNYIMFVLISTAGSIINYKREISMISHQNQIDTLNRSLEIVATHDTLTRLNNRYSLNVAMPNFLNSDLCIAMLDINDFKSVNDTYGHQTGDMVLEHVADTLRKFFPDDSLFRYGGDEFLVLYKTDDLEGFKSSLKEVNNELKSNPVKNTYETISCSFGTIYTRAATPVELMECVADADRILYKIKKQRKTDNS